MEPWNRGTVEPWRSWHLGGLRLELPSSRGQSLHQHLQEGHADLLAGIVAHDPDAAFDTVAANLKD
ncbi:hypothetical protein MB46_14175 [Arthrobacter alpinus]|uniref:hypothetical protein n=1 Tax=Arthrobacter alpinus TaxID=656366 RepID=UPI0005C84E64|nr:hypothetical protein [Arthrobacter alpinus]ALV46463.1 hypothetical protein MB46_14175 [Arthrobacter alpinus]